MTCYVIDIIRISIIQTTEKFGVGLFLICPSPPFEFEDPLSYRAARAVAPSTCSRVVEDAARVVGRSPYHEFEEFET
jgi:hypothetical protein